MHGLASILIDCGAKRKSFPKRIAEEGNQSPNGQISVLSDEDMKNGQKFGFLPFLSVFAPE